MIKFLKQFLLSFLSVFLVTILMFIFHLFLNASHEKFILPITLIMLFIAFIYGFYNLFTGRLKIGFYQGRIGAFLIIAISILLTINITIISILNISYSRFYDGQDTVSQKVEHYKDSIKMLLLMHSQIKNVDSYTATMNAENFNYFNFYYDDKIDKKYIEIIKDSVPQVEKATENIFGYIDKKDLNVIFYSNENDFKNNIMGFNGSVELNYLTGLYDGIQSIHLNSFSDESKDILDETFKHEYTHYIYHSYLLQNDILDNTPLWFAEGISEYIKYDGSIIEYSPLWLQYTEKFTKMNTNQDFERLFINKKYNPYLQSYYAIDSLIKMEGPKIITDILQKSKEKDFYEAFSEEVGISIEAFENIYLKEYIAEYNRKKLK